jgi:hypothetical protein
LALLDTGVPNASFHVGSIEEHVARRTINKHMISAVDRPDGAIKHWEDCIHATAVQTWRARLASIQVRVGDVLVQQARIALLLVVGHSILASIFGRARQNRLPRGPYRARLKNESAVGACGRPVSNLFLRDLATDCCGEKRTETVCQANSSDGAGLAIRFLICACLILAV